MDPESQFDHLPELVRHHSINPVCLISVLRYPVSNPCNPPIDLLNKVDEWEMNHTEIFIKDRLKNFGQYYEEVYQGFTKNKGVTVTVKTFIVS